jgi:hypothetical protein
MAALSLRGRRQRRAVILFDDGAAPLPAGVEQLGLEVVPITAAAGVLADALGHTSSSGPAETPELDR